ncbi:MAG: serine/threonine protein kinase, partial [Muribaculaceae bacterium]|nr:serine/threonine protein kinase [Muribaculaceae bacterium]
MERNYGYALRPGTVLHGNQTYIIRGVLGAGGFGITYLAETSLTMGNIEVTVSVAVKEHFIKDYCSRGSDATSVRLPDTGNLAQQVADARRDFLSEARRLAQVGAGHPNIVKVNEVFEANGTAYYVMEYLDGASLWDNIQTNGPMDEATLRTVLTPIVEAVAYLHAGKLTHLDIKPANIMLTVRKDGSVRPVLIDFGLSKHYDEHGNATSTINTLGASDGYAPVEQYLGIRTFSPTADVYSLGATMLACLTGTTPLRASEWQPGQIEATVAQLPVGDSLKAVIVKAMQPHPSARYSDAGAMLAAISGLPAPA